jgi:hypothetical protein
VIWLSRAKSGVLAGVHVREQLGRRRAVHALHASWALRTGSASRALQVTFANVMRERIERIMPAFWKGCG